jgi:hypothetical protein
MRADDCRSLPWVDRGGAHLDPGGLFLQPKGDAAIHIAPPPRFMASITICSARLATGIGTSHSRPSSVARTVSLRDRTSAKTGRLELPFEDRPRQALVRAAHPPHRAPVHTLSQGLWLDPGLHPQRQAFGDGLADAMADHVDTTLHTVAAPMMLPAEKTLPRRRPGSACRRPPGPRYYGAG